MESEKNSIEIVDDPVVIAVPASKSLSHRYLIGASLADGQSTIRNVLESRDTEATRGILCQAGARMKPLHDNSSEPYGITGWQIWGMNGVPQGGQDAPLQCDVVESGTTCRLLTGVLAAGKGLFRIFGHGRMHERPMGELCEVLQQLGCGITYQEKTGYPPVLLDAHGLTPGLVDGYARIGMEQSSQYFSALLLAAPMADGPLSIELAGNKVVSWPYVGLTLQCMAEFGINFQVEIRPRIGVPWIPLQAATWRNLGDARPGCLRVRIRPGKYRAGDYEVEGDWSGASYFLAAGALGKRPVQLAGLRPDSLQGDRAMIDILQKMGARMKIEKNSVTVFPSSLHGVALDMGACPDLVPTVAVLAAFARGSTRINNVAHLRIKESDRITAPAQELAKAGVVVDALSDGLLVSGLAGRPATLRNRPSSPRLSADAELCAHNDHRIAMSLALLEMADASLNVRDRLDNADVVGKSFPKFWDLWDKLQCRA